MKRQTKAELIQQELDANHAARGATESRADTQEAAEVMAAQVRRAATVKERQDKFRKGKRAAGLEEVRGIFAKVDHHKAIKLFADALQIGFILPKRKAQKELST
jgi:hypothetical protein